MTSRSTKVLFASLAVAGLLLAGCAKSKKSNLPVTGSVPEATTTSTSVVNGTSIALAMGTATSGALQAIVQASVGGGPMVPMILDTGSSGVMVLPAAVGPNVTTTSQGAALDIGGAGVNGTMVSAPVTVGSLSTTGSINIYEIGSGNTPPASLAPLFTNGVQGVIGIGLSDADTVATVFSPLLQMGGSANSGFTISLPVSASSPGSLIVGPVSAPSSASSVPIARLTPSTYPNGAPAYSKDVTLCWTVGTSKGCGLTDLDTGAPETLIVPSALPGGPQSNGTVDSGTPVTVAIPNGATIWQITTGATISRNVVQLYSQLPPPTQFNTGIAFYLGNQVGFDLINGKVWIWK
jgi:hypothetical protein